MTEVQASEGMNRGGDPTEEPKVLRRASPGMEKDMVIGTKGHPSHVGRDIQTKSKD